MSTRRSLSVGDGTSKNKCYLSLSTQDERKTGTKIQSTWCHELSRVERMPCRNVVFRKQCGNTKKDRSREGEAVTVGMDLMIPSFQLPPNRKKVIFVSTIFIYAPTYTLQPLDGTTKQRCFLTRWSAWGIFFPLSLYIFLENQASLPRPQLQSATLLKGEENIIWGVDLTKGVLSSVSGLTLLTSEWYSSW